MRTSVRGDGDTDTETKVDGAIGESVLDARVRVGG